MRSSGKRTRARGKAAREKAFRYEFRASTPVTRTKFSSSRHEMNRAIYIIMVPVVFVAVGYILIFRAVGLAPGYGRLLVAMALFVGLAWWMVRKSAKTSRPQK